MSAPHGATADRPARVLVLGYGNPGRGDDALGPLVIERLESLYPSGPFTFLTDFQLQVEHSLDLLDQDLCLLVDAHLTAPPPFVFERVSPDPIPSFSTHWVSPGTLLKLHQDLHGDAPPLYLLGVRGESYELGEPLSASAHAHLEKALSFIEGLLNQPTPDHWLRCLNDCATRPKGHAEGVSGTSHSTV